jgi:hypothetical protein
MNTLTDLVSEAISDFGRAAALANAEFSTNTIMVEILEKPHNAPRFLPNGKQAVYAFFFNRQALKIGKVGPNSGPRYTSQHYNRASANSNLAQSILSNPRKLGALEIAPESVGDWIKLNTDRVNLLVPATDGVPVLSFLESFLHVRWKPVFEGRSEAE